MNTVPTGSGSGSGSATLAAALKIVFLLFLCVKSVVSNQMYSIASFLLNFDF
jgi:homoserine kinase